MRVNLIGETSFTSCGIDRAVASIARVCTTPAGEAVKHTDPEQVRSLLNKLIKNGHMSVFEHVNLTYEIIGISRACSLQLARHRHISRTEQSQRYTKLIFDKIPDTMEELEKYFVYPPNVSVETLDRLTSVYCDALYDYKALIEQGVKSEDARFVLPEATKTHMIITLNLRTLAELCEKRRDNEGAQWEIRELVDRMVRKLSNTDSIAFIYTALLEKKKDD